MHVPERLRDGLVDADARLAEPISLERLLRGRNLGQLLADVLALLRRDLRRRRKSGDLVADLLQQHRELVQVERVVRV